MSYEPGSVAANRRCRLVLAQVVSCCVYEMPKQYWTVHEGQ